MLVNRCVTTLLTSAGFTSLNPTGLSVTVSSMQVLFLTKQLHMTSLLYMWQKDGDKVYDKANKDNEDCICYIDGLKI